MATEAFREHVTSLIGVGTYLAMNLDIPQTITAESPNGEQIVDSLWQANVLGEVQDQTLRQLSGTQAERAEPQYYPPASDALSVPAGSHTR